MAKISNTTSYPNATPAANDYVIGTDIDDNNATKTFKLQEIANLYAGSGSGTVTSVGLDGGTTGITITSDTTNPITTTGTFTLGGTLAVANGGTGATTLTTGNVLIGNGTSSVSFLNTAVKGTMLVGEAGGTTALAVGTDGHVLTAASSEGVGVRWTAATVNASNITGTLAVAKGGTGLTALGTAGQVLKVNSAATALEFGTGGGGPGSGTQYSIPFWSNSSTLGDSMLSQNSTGNLLSIPSGTLSITSGGTSSIPSIAIRDANTGIFSSLSGRISLGVSGTESLTIDATNGVVLGPLTQFNAGLKFGAGGETLSSYEEGTWTPQIQLSVGGAATQSSQSGSYTLIGDFVFADFIVTISSAGYGVMTMDGLPFAAQSAGGNYGTVQLHNNPDDAGANIQHVNSGSIIGSNVFFKVLDAAALDANGLVLKAASSAAPLSSGDVIAGTLIYKKA
jgi:hypothetical protein|tara:strand:+ start:3067 stop:4422 length:1356 start_codon:yes stop_codon:yes gene_type:complete